MELPAEESARLSVCLCAQIKWIIIIMHATEPARLTSIVNPWNGQEGKVVHRTNNDSPPRRTDQHVGPGIDLARSHY